MVCIPMHNCFLLSKWSIATRIPNINIISSTRSQARDGKDKLSKLPTRRSWAPRGTLAPPPAPPTPPALRRATPTALPTPPPSDRIESGWSTKERQKNWGKLTKQKNRSGLLSAEISEKSYLWAEQGSQMGNLCCLARLVPLWVAATAI